MKAVKTSDDIIATLRQAKPEIEGRFGVRSMAIFGSHARGESREDSDVDILVDVDPAIGLETHLPRCFRQGIGGEGVTR
jgi:predicted nucleotidyltransferase